MNAVLDRYMRYIVVNEANSGVSYWVAGSNSTKSVASRLVNFTIDPSDVDRLRAHGEKIRLPVPRIRRHRDLEDDLLWKIEKSVEDLSEENLDLLLDSLDNEDERVRLEAALTLRAFSDFIRDSSRRQAETEERVLNALENIKEEETQCALAENLGYFGREASVARLAELLRSDYTMEHVRWATAIALGRLPGIRVQEHLLPPLENIEHDWTKVALVLAIARNAEEYDREVLEPIFRKLLGAENPPLLVRYSCLGLSRFEAHDDETAQLLTAVLGDDQLGVEVRGYSALAISSALSSYTDARISSIRRILSRFARQSPTDMADPEAIWGVEFLAELASILEQSEVSATLNGLLADHFDDWRAGYYTCMKHYEQGESAVRKTAGDDAIMEYRMALASLKPRGAAADGLPPEAAATMQFRKDIVENRLNLQMIVSDWIDAVRPDDLFRLAEEIDPVFQGYRRYSKITSRIGPDKQLVDKEREYIKNTSNLVAIIQLLIQFDHRLRVSDAAEITGDDILAELMSISEDLKKLGDRFKTGFALSLHELVKKLLVDLQTLERSLSNPETPMKDKLRLCRSAMTSVRVAFWSASWPMPGRACPVYGLGRAKFVLKTEGIEGDGTEEKPYVFPATSPTVLNVSVTIFEMAPGGSTTLRLLYTLGKSVNSENIPIVEDEYTCTLRIDDRLPTYSPIRLDVVLEFQARDCTQIAEKKSIYIISREQ